MKINIDKKALRYFFVLATIAIFFPPYELHYEYEQDCWGVIGCTDGLVLKDIEYGFQFIFYPVGEVLFSTLLVELVAIFILSIGLTKLPMDSIKSAIKNNYLDIVDASLLTLIYLMIIAGHSNNIANSLTYLVLGVGVIVARYLPKREIWKTIRFFLISIFIFAGIIGYVFAESVSKTIPYNPFDDISKEKISNVFDKFRQQQREEKDAQEAFNVPEFFSKELKKLAEGADEPSVSRKIAYGTAKQRSMFGVLYRNLVEASYKSLTEGKSHWKARNKLLSERKSKLFKEFPEFSTGKYDYNDKDVDKGRKKIFFFDLFLFLLILFNLKLKQRIGNFRKSK